MDTPASPDSSFQLLNPAYPEARRALDIPSLELSPFAPGVVVRNGDHQLLLADPFRAPVTLAATVRTHGPLSTKIAAARWLGEAGYLPPRRLHRPADGSLQAELSRRGLSAPSDPIGAFMAGVLGEGDLSSSVRVVRFLVRAFVRGTRGPQRHKAVPKRLVP